MRPHGKVRITSRGTWQRVLAWEGRLFPLGEQESQEVAEATYDVAKMLVSRCKTAEGRLLQAACACGGRRLSPLARPLPLHLTCCRWVLAPASFHALKSDRSCSLLPVHPEAWRAAKRPEAAPPRRRVHAAPTVGPAVGGTAQLSPGVQPAGQRPGRRLPAASR